MISFHPFPPVPAAPQVDSIDNSGLVGGEGGYAVVLATVDESADLWATNGKKGDSYKTTYQVRWAPAVLGLLGHAVLSAAYELWGMCCAQRVRWRGPQAAVRAWQ